MALWMRIDNGIAAESTTIDPSNRFHPDIKWVSAPDGTEVGELYDGSVFTRPPAPAPVVPQTVSRTQARLALLAIDSPTNTGKKLLDDVDAAIAGNPDRRFTEAWNSSTVVERHGLFVHAIAPTIPGLDNDAALDALFIAAAQIIT